MQGTLTINLAKPVTSAEILDNYGVGPPCNILQNDAGGVANLSFGHSVVNSAEQTQHHVFVTDAEKQKAEVAHLCQTLNRLVEQLNQFYDGVLARHKVEIARLSVEIARKILMHTVQKGDFKIESIVKEVLEHAPTRRAVVVHLNPADLGHCQKLQQDDPTGAFAEIQFVSDPNIGRAECLLETPKGIIKWFIDEHMERISQALEKVG
jgi:flagellar biosynthesis/type III secretory pathway protein FliH